MHSYCIGPNWYLGHKTQGNVSRHHSTCSLDCQCQTIQPLHMEALVKNIKSEKKGAEVKAIKKKKNTRNNTVVALRGARGRPQRPRLSSTLTSGSREPSASSVGWSAEVRECGSSLLHARTSREAKKKTKMPSIGEEREAGEEKGNRASWSVPSASLNQHPDFYYPHS